jgi:Skp family chaperone for outer membrane proteins
MRNTKRIFVDLTIGFLALAAICLSLEARFKTRTFAFVDTQRLLTGFKEAHKVNKEIQVEDEKWRKDLKAIEDSLKAHMDYMSAHYDASDAKKKKEMQDELSLRNQQMNNFERMNMKRVQELTDKKMAGVYEKINTFMKEFGKTKGYDIVFGTVNGSIIYGEGSKADVTNDVVELLNKRYE